MKGKSLQLNDGMSRRRFLTFSGFLALSATALGRPLAANALRFNSNLYQVSGGRISMGTFVNVILFDPSKDRAQEAMEKAFAKMTEHIATLSCHDLSTPVSYLNQQGVLKDIPPDLGEVFRAAFDFHQRSSGAFDITVKPLLDLYEKSFEAANRPPSRDEIDSVLNAVGTGKLLYGTNEVRFQQDQMGVTLDGIAKGYIVDRMIDELKSSGIKHALVNAGGDIRVIGSRGDGAPWNIGIQDPWNEDKILDTIQLTQGAVATSGNYEVYFDNEKLYHHIISPQAGKPAKGLTSVSVVAPTTMEADALSTGIFVMGAGKGSSFLKSSRGIGGLLVTADERKFYSNWSRRV